MVSVEYQQQLTKIHCIAITSIIITPISLVTEMNFKIGIWCQSDVLPESLVIMVNSTSYNISSSSLVNEFNTTFNQTGFDVVIQCIWTVNQGTFMNETILNGNITTIIIIFYANSLASLIPVPNVVESPTSISVNWMTIPDANGYIIYVNDAIYMYVVGSTNTSIIVDRLIPGTSYSITVRAYQDILGPASTTIAATTNNGIILNYIWCMWLSMSNKIIRITQ